MSVVCEAWVRWIRTGAVWLVLFALALPGFALARGICCEASSTRNSHCCASAMKSMTAMDSRHGSSSSPELSSLPLWASSSSSRLLALPAFDSSGVTAGIPSCEPAFVWHLPQFLPEGDGAAGYKVSSIRDASPVAGGLASLDAPLRITHPRSHVDRTLLTLFSFDPLSVALRV
jgi:hypothetical protein